jgi:hypothetical protein
MPVQTTIKKRITTTIAKGIAQIIKMIENAYEAKGQVNTAQTKMKIARPE